MYFFIIFMDIPGITIATVFLAVIGLSLKKGINKGAGYVMMGIIVSYLTYKIIFLINNWDNYWAMPLPFSKA